MASFLKSLSPLVFLRPDGPIPVLLGADYAKVKKDQFVVGLLADERGGLSTETRWCCLLLPGAMTCYMFTPK